MIKKIKTILIIVAFVSLLAVRFMITSGNVGAGSVATFI